MTRNEARKGRSMKGKEKKEGVKYEREGGEGRGGV